MCELQQGAEAVLSISGTYEVTNITRYSAPIPVIDDTTLASEDGREKCAGQLEDPQMITITAKSIGTVARPAKGVVQTLTITSALVPGNATADIFAGPGFVVDVKEPEYGSDTEARKTFEIDWQFDGKSLPARTLATVTP
jgi:hypothetical protein